MCPARPILGRILAVPVLLLLAAASADANVGVVQIYYASHWMGLIGIVVSVFVEGLLLGWYLHPRRGGQSVRDRAFVSMVLANALSLLVVFAFPHVDASDLPAYLGSQGIMRTNLWAFIAAWTVFSAVLESPIAAFMMWRTHCSPVSVVSGVILANALSSVCLAAGILAFRLWY
jgi:hypothetical protein